jgi:predicted phage terminase large subunit-like protein
LKLLELAALLKPTYIADWYHALLADLLQRCADGDPDVPNLLISSPPGSGKTELIGILFPTSIFADHQSAHVIALANSDPLARLASGNVLRLVQHSEFQERYPFTLDKATEAQWTIHGNDGRPSMHAAGIMGQLTGQRADFLIFDDLIKSQSECMSEVIRERTWANFLSAAETRLLPDGKIVGISTRWHLDDPIGRLLRRAEENRHARQFLYVSLAAWNGGEDSFVLDTRTHQRKCLPPYRALASVQRQPYSFSRKQLLGKQADLGSSRFSALYMQQPQSLEDQLFPEKVWASIGQVNADDLLLVASAWDTASKTGEKNDFTANVVIGRLRSGGFVVVDVWKAKLNFAKLPDVVLQRYGLLMERYRTIPLLVVEDAVSGTQLIDTIRSRDANIPLIAAKPVKAKIIRAEGVTPITTAGLVALPRDAAWRADFVKEMGDFPVGQHDDVPDAFCHGMKAFTTARDFKTPDLPVMPGHLQSEYEAREAQRQELFEEWQYENDTRIGDDFGHDF